MQLTIYDTSLRDGLQGEKVNLNLEDKLEVARALDEIGVHYIEGGFPLSSAQEMEFFKRARRMHFRRAKLAAFGSTKKPGVNASEDINLNALLAAETEIVTVVGKSWSRHVEQVLKTTKEENLALIFDSIAFLKQAGRQVFFDAEHFFDGLLDDAPYALRVIQTAWQAGAALVVLCDTNGGMTHRQVQRLLKQVNEFRVSLDQVAPPRFGVHFHDDTGQAVALSLISLDYGANQIQGTVNHWGERCGNANLTTIIPTIHFKFDNTLFDDQALLGLTKKMRYFDALANLPHSHKQPYTGSSAFAHKGGQHADVILKNPNLMEHLDPNLLGNTRRVLLSELAGKATIAYKLRKFGAFDKNSKAVRELALLLKQREQAGYAYEAAEASFELLMRKQISLYQPIFEVVNYWVTMDVKPPSGEGGVMRSNPAYSSIVAYVEVKIEGKLYSGGARGVGPVDALDKALRRAIKDKYGFVEALQLEDYRVRVLNSEKATSAAVRVFIDSKTGKERWSTIGVSTNIIEASWQALKDAFDFKYNQDYNPVPLAPA